MSKKSWNSQETCKLIELYRETSLLWNTKNMNYKNRYKKRDALKEFATILNTTLEEIDRKLKNKNSQYARERRIYNNLKKSGAGKSFHSKWFGYSLIIFLRDKIKQTKNMDSDSTSDVSDKDHKPESSTENSSSFENESFKNSEINTNISCDTDETLTKKLTICTNINTIIPC